MRGRDDAMNDRNREALESDYLYWCEQAMVDVVGDYEDWSNLKLENTISLLRDIVFDNEN